MTKERYRRKLAAILSMDVKGYSRLMGDDDAMTVRTITTYREMITSLVQQSRGRVVDSPGDNILNSACPSIHHSDQGVQYAAHAYIDLLKLHNTQISMSSVGKAEENGYAERVIRTIKEEEVDLSEYLDFSDAAHQIGHFNEDVYMTKRIHSSLGYLTPAEFERADRRVRTQDA